MALELRARAGDQLGRLVAVAALEGQDAELRETQRVQRGAVTAARRAPIVSTACARSRSPSR